MQSSSYIRAYTNKELELERYFGKIKATCARKTIVTLFDLIYLLAVNLPIFVLFAWWTPDASKLDFDIIHAFHQLVEKSTQIAAIRMLLFSLWMCFMLYIYFVLIPSKTNYQTFFSSYLGMKAVSIEDNITWQGKLKQSKLFRANFVPVFSIPFMCVIFFYCAWITNNTDWYEKIVKEGFKKMYKFSDVNNVLETKQYWVYGMKMIIIVVFFLQIHHLFTVSASKRALNWFTKSNKIIYVNVERALVVMETEPKKSLMTFVEEPVIASEKIEEEIIEEVPVEEEEVKETPLTIAEKIDFSEDIEMPVDEFLERLKRNKEQEEK